MRLAGSSSRQAESPHRGAYVWVGVPAEDVADFLDDFLVHPRNHDFQADSIAEFLRSPKNTPHEHVDRWTIAFMNDGEGDPFTLPSLLDLNFRAKKRQIDIDRSINSILVSGRKARVGSRPDLKHGLTSEQLSRLYFESGQKKSEIHEDQYREIFENPLMIFYMIQGVDRRKQLYKEGLLLPALALHFPGIKDDSVPKRYIKYRLNKVAQAEAFSIDIDDDDLAGDPDEPD